MNANQKAIEQFEQNEYGEAMELLIYGAIDQIKEVNEDVNKEKIEENLDIYEISELK